MTGKEKLMATLRSKLGTTWSETEAIYEAFVASVKESLDSGETVRIPQIGVLEKRDLPAGTAKNPATGAEVTVGARTKYAMRSKPRAVQA